MHEKDKIMAFEDRCSPQSAPSPPGIPHSPQNTSSATAMIYNNNNTTEHNNSSPINQEMSLSISTNQQLSMQVRVKQENESSPSPDVVTNQLQPINFSITKILSDNFGKISKKCEKRNSLFRPYDINENSSSTNSISNSNNNNSQNSKCVNKLTVSSVHKLSKYRRNSQSPADSAIDFSRTTTNGSVENVKNNLFASFNVSSSYPKIHEEILNSKHKFHQLHQHAQSPQQQHQQQQQYHQYHHQLAESAFSKIPPLGNLCKTVSQIGQSKCISPAIKNDLLPSPTSSTSSSMHHQHTISANQQISQSPLTPSGRDSGMDSSDDTKSESGSSTKDGDSAQLWPAWVYCTRYSDRPSSGK